MNLNRLLIGTITILLCSSAQSARIKDLATIRGARDNQLSGYGVVVGLSGMGDKNFDLTMTSVVQVLKGMGVDPKQQKFDTKNAAAVIVSAILPPFSRMGSHLDVTISSVGTASSLDGGILLMTALRGADGQVYAMAQGKVVTLKRDGGGSKASGQSMVTAAVPGGALLEKEINFDLGAEKVVKYQLLTPDFTTAARISRRINDELGGKYATAVDPATVEVIFPYTWEGTPVDLIAQIEAIEVEADRRAKVVINQRTGTVVLGENVRVLPVAIAHNNLKIEVKDEDRKPGSNTPTGPQRLMLMGQGTSVAEIAAGLNAMGAGADDLISLIQALKASGALVAEIETQ